MRAEAPSERRGPGLHRAQPKAELHSVADPAAVIGHAQQQVVFLAAQHHLYVPCPSVHGGVDDRLARDPDEILAVGRLDFAITVQPGLRIRSAPALGGRTDAPARLRPDEEPPPYSKPSMHTGL